MSKRVFKEWDDVYHYSYGWGYVQEREEHGFAVSFYKDKEVFSRLVPADELSFTEYNLVDGGLSHERPFKLEMRGSYVSVHEHLEGMVINLKGGETNYGFWDGKWRDDLLCGVESNWREATDEEVISALENEACKRFGENWKNVKLKNDISSSVESSYLNKGIYDAGVQKCYRGYWNVASINGFLFYRGTWAEKVEEPEIAPGDPVLVRKDLDTWVFGHYSHYESNHSYPHVVSGGSNWKYCIPFNDETKHLVGTKNEFKEPIKI